MKIQVGVKNWNELEFFLKEDVDEFYAGSVNLPGHLYGVEDFSNEVSLLKICEIVHKRRKRFFVVANEVRGDLFDVTLKNLNFLLKNGVDGVIVRDVALLRELKRIGFKDKEFILSSLVLCFNRYALEFYADLGITRLALPEQITREEGVALIKNSRNIATEIFFTPIEYCSVLNGFCYLHINSVSRCVCLGGFKSGNKVFSMPRPSLREQLLNFYSFYKAGAEVIKIGRAPFSFIKQMFREVYLIRELLYISKCGDEFVEKGIKIHNRFKEIFARYLR